MLIKDECYAVRIIDFNSKGEGIGKINGLTVFIPDAIPGDTILVEIIHKKRNYIEGRLKQILSPSTERKDPLCMYSKLCGGCNFQSMNYEAQIAYKKKRVIDSLERIGQLDNPRVMDVVAMEEPWRYRNKVQYSVEGCNVGFYKRNSHKTIDCKTCLLQARPVNHIVEAIREFINEGRLSAYDSVTGKGTLCKILIRTAYFTGEVMVILVATKFSIPYTDLLIEKIKNAITLTNNEIKGNMYNLKSFILTVSKNRNGDTANIENKVLYGDGKIKDRLMGMDFEISPDSFYQINSLQTEKLYKIVAKYADLTKQETLLDLYCGIGTIGLTLARDAKQVIGVEASESAVYDARQNSFINGVKNAKFIYGKAEKKLPELIYGGMKCDVLILDPPRAGCDTKLLKALAPIDIDRIIYVSCNPATLARDIRFLTQKGFRFKEAYPVDMFPQTVHVETVVLITKKND